VSKWLLFHYQLLPYQLIPHSLTHLLYPSNNMEFIGLLVFSIAFITSIVFITISIWQFSRLKEPSNNIWLSSEKPFFIFGGLLIFGMLIWGILDMKEKKATLKARQDTLKIPVVLWEAPSDNILKFAPNQANIIYGRELIKNTASYLGPRGAVAHLTNGMNCQNCHLDAGTKAWGNNYGSVAATYPKFRERSGTKESIEKRVNDCMERSLNGKPLDSLSREMRAIVAYIKWLGQYIPKEKKAKGAGIAKLKFLERAANPNNGKALYAQKCVSCHGAEGQGVKSPDGIVYTYPPLWGEHSYNIGAGLFRLSNLAGYIRDNMPLGASYKNQQLTNEEAWDIAAFVNSMPRPNKDISKDWSKQSAKPFDHPFGPFSDPFSEQQHKFGPFKEIVAFKETH
jgi:thiosulfate dehydrogenase